MLGNLKRQREKEREKAKAKYSRRLDWSKKKKKKKIKEDAHLQSFILSLFFFFLNFLIPLNNKSWTPSTNNNLPHVRVMTFSVPLTRMTYFPNQKAIFFFFLKKKNYAWWERE